MHTMQYNFKNSSLHLYRGNNIFINMPGMLFKRSLLFILDLNSLSQVDDAQE